jgi:hypothetical protein
MHNKLKQRSIYQSLGLKRLSAQDLHVKLTPVLGPNATCLDRD